MFRVYSFDRWRPSTPFARASGIAALGLVAGIAIRLWQFHLNRPLWIDEAMLAVSVVTRSVSGLMRPLLWDQVAPPGYLIWTHLFGLLGGFSEQGLRASALLAGCVVLIMLWRVGDQVLGREGLPALIWLAAVNPALVYYSNEAKPYQFDAAFAVGLTLAYLKWRGGNRKAFVWLAVVGALSVWFSAAAVFVLGGLICAHVQYLVLVKPSERQRLRSVAVVPIAWGASFALAYVLTYERAATSQYMQEFWTRSYLRPFGGAGLHDAVTAVARCLWGLMVGPPPFHRGFPPTPPATAIALAVLATVLVPIAIIGLRQIRGKSVAAANAIAWPFIVVALASAAGFYPLATRLLLALLPGILILLTAGFVRLACAMRTPLRHPELALGLALPVILLGIPENGRWRLAPIHWSDARAIVAQVSQDSIPVYVSARAAPLWAYYAEARGHGSDSSVEWIHARAGPTGVAFENRMGTTPFIRPAASDLISAGPKRLMLGMGTGMQWRYLTGFTQEAPDQGWQAFEVDRIVGAAAPQIWLVFLHDMEDLHRTLTIAVLRRGASVERRICGDNAAAILVTVNKPATASRVDMPASLNLERQVCE